MSQIIHVSAELDYQPDCSAFVSPNPQSLSDLELRKRITYCERRNQQLVKTARTCANTIIRAMHRPETTSDDVLALARTERASLQQAQVYEHEAMLLKQILVQRQEQGYATS